MRQLLDVYRIDDLPRSARRNYFYESRYFSLWVLLIGTLDVNLSALIAKKTFGASDQLTAFIWSIPILMNIANPIWGGLLRGRRRVTAMLYICMAVVICLASISLNSPGLGSWAAYVFAGQLVCTHFFWSGLITARTALWQVNYPASHRARITGRLQVLRISAVLVIPLMLGAIYDQAPYAYRFVYPAAALIGLLALIPLRQVRVRHEDHELATQREAAANAPQPRVAGPARLLHETGSILRKDRLFRNYMGAQFLLGGANFFTEPILLIVLAEQLEFGFLQIAIIMNLVRSLVMLLATPTWSAYFDRVGIFRFRVTNSTFWVLSYAMTAAAMLTLMFAGPGSAPLVVGIIIIARILNGLGGAGGQLAWPLGHLAFAKGQDANLYLGIHVSLTGFRGLIMPQVSSLLRNATPLGNGTFAIAILLSGSANLLFRRLMRYDRQAEDEPRVGPRRAERS